MRELTHVVATTIIIATGLHHHTKWVSQHHGQKVTKHTCQFSRIKKIFSRRRMCRSSTSLIPRGALQGHLSNNRMRQSHMMIGQEEPLQKSSSSILQYYMRNTFCTHVMLFDRQYYYVIHEMACCSSIVITRFGKSQVGPKGQHRRYVSAILLYRTHDSISTSKN